MLKLGTSPRTLGAMSCGRLFSLIVLVGLAAVTGLAVPEALAQAVEPQSLVGEWEGTWVYASSQDLSGDYNMTVTKVEGSKVYGRVDRFSRIRMVTTKSFDFVGTLEGDKLVFAGSGDTGEVTIYRTSYGIVMKGVGFESIRTNISLTKRK